MSDPLYRVIAPCALLGLGFPDDSMQLALAERVDAIVCNAGATDVGPFYLGAGHHYFDRAAVKADYRRLVAAARMADCPLVIGNSGTAGGDRHVDWMIDIAREVFDELGISGVHVAVIRSQIQAQTLIDTGLAFDAAVESDSILIDDAFMAGALVGEMGVHPIIAALSAGARFIIAGRACPAALFAADMIRCGIDAGIAYHAGHVLQAGALACVPGSPSDCLVAEIHHDGSAIFLAPNPLRRCTATSIAAHALYGQVHPRLQHKPEGVLTTEHTQFFSQSGGRAGCKGSRFVDRHGSSAFSFRLEGARKQGFRKVSLICIDPSCLRNVPDDIPVYGRNGVEALPLQDGQQELGVLIITRGDSLDRVSRLALLLTRRLNRQGYPGRPSNVGNLARPMSPNVVSCRRADGRFEAFSLSGTRDFRFIQHFSAVAAAAVASAKEQAPELFVDMDVELIEASAARPIALVRTISPDPDAIEALHQLAIQRISANAISREGSYFSLNSPDSYTWSVNHLIKSSNGFGDTCFPISMYLTTGGDWQALGEFSADYFGIGNSTYRGDLDIRTLHAISDHSNVDAPIGFQTLSEMASVIRSSDAGINRLTYDIVFDSAESYEAALHSNIFCKSNVEVMLGLAPSEVIGSFFDDDCNAIKVSVFRDAVGRSIDERDIYASQQHSRLAELKVPFYQSVFSEM